MINSDDGGVLKAYNRGILYRSRIEAATKGNSFGAYANIVNFNDSGERALYGRVDRNYVPMETQPDSNNFLSLKTVKDPQRPLVACNFVASLFESFVKEFKLLQMEQKLSPNSKYLYEPRAYKAYADPFRAYEKYLDSFEEALREHLGQKRMLIDNFKTFMSYLMPFVERVGLTYPLTRPGFIKSKYCSPLVSGLAIEIADVAPNNMTEKIGEFLTDPNWHIYVEVCNKYGFLIDGNLPWRIIMDIDAEGIRETTSQMAGVQGAYPILNRFYQSSHTSYYGSFTAFLIRMYNRIKTPTSMRMQECSDGTIRHRFVSTPSYTVSTLKEEMGEKYFLISYYKIRLIEDETTMSAREQQRFLNDCALIYDSVGLNTSLFVFERILNLPFDYVGSINYNKIKQQLIEDAKAKQMGASVLPSSYSGGY